MTLFYFVYFIVDFFCSSAFFLLLWCSFFFSFFYTRVLLECFVNCIRPERRTRTSLLWNWNSTGVYIVITPLCRRSLVPPRGRTFERETDKIAVQLCDAVRLTPPLPIQFFILSDRSRKFLYINFASVSFFLSFVAAVVLSRTAISKIVWRPANEKGRNWLRPFSLILPTQNLCTL